MVFQRIAVALWEFRFCVFSMKFRRFFIEIRGWRCTFPARPFSAHFDDLASVFHRIVVEAIPVFAVAISMIFHWFFNEMGLRRSRSEILFISMILLMLFHRNDVPTAASPNLAISICFHIEISQNRCPAVRHRFFANSMIWQRFSIENFVSGDFQWSTQEPVFWSRQSGRRAVLISMIW